jgi:hypothetical protein
MAGVGPGGTRRDATEYLSSLQAFGELERVHAFVTTELRSFALFTRL